MKSYKEILNEGNKALDSKGKELKVGDNVKIDYTSVSEYAGEIGEIFQIVRHKSAGDSMILKVKIPARNNIKVNSPIPANQTTKLKDKDSDFGPNLKKFQAKNKQSLHTRR